MEGSGLSDATLYTSAGIHGAELFPIISEMPFDVLTVGNHDLYDDETIGFMVSSGFIDGWNGHYLTSNTFSSNDNTRVGSPYIILEGDVTQNKYLFFGFLFHMEDSCDSMKVTDPADEVEEDWFAEALGEGIDQNVRAVVIMSHMDMVDDAVYSILDKIRSFPGYEDLAIQFVTGHTHYRGFNKLDYRASSFEAGHYLDTVGLLTMNLPPADEYDDGSQIWFGYYQLDANKENLMSLVNMTTEEEVRIFFLVCSFVNLQQYQSGSKPNKTNLLTINNHDHNTDHNNEHNYHNYSMHSLTLTWVKKSAKLQ